MKPVDVFQQIVLEAIEYGFQAGIETFMEQLNEELEKDAIFESYALEGVIEKIVMDSGIMQELQESDNGELQDIPEEQLDAMLKQLEQEVGE